LDDVRLARPKVSEDDGWRGHRTAPAPAAAAVPGGAAAAPSGTPLYPNLDDKRVLRSDSKTKMPPPPYSAEVRSETRQQRKMKSTQVKTERGDDLTDDEYTDEDIDIDPPQLRKRTAKSVEKRLPMVEVAGHEGPILVHRPWTETEIKEAGMHLPDLGKGGIKVGQELTAFCREFRPTGHELTRLMKMKYGPVTMLQMEGRWMAADERCRNIDWGDDENKTYRDALERLVKD